MNARVEAFFDPATFTYSYVVSDPTTRQCALIDSVLDYEPASGRIGHASADRLIAHVRTQELEVQWILETHVHADHLSAAAYLKRQLGGRRGIGERITQIQETFGELFNTGDEFARDGSQFDHLFRDGEDFQVGAVPARALHTPGHTPACLTYLIGDAAFVGDTLFMPDYGTARCDFPGGDARTLYRSIHRLYRLPDETRVFMCHDYKASGRAEFLHQTSMGEERKHNVHAHQGIDEEVFVAMRNARDATLGMPALILPAVQVNMCAGELPPAEDNGIRYLKIPLNAL
ncbi:MBL fold metallo-hydrolase [Azotobacter beijerinckii]|uniref:Glyoxylase, beta-lactamase superfamily II n=1 Tax=Azotobacter beijerinckii TaxID=170623 RepID=A0A1I4CX18_9GAMM|nr:MBL fold metallo-hydrolase [Azotobacter beijerinckii]SFB49421.1 Glyoxylase, beta-lactamase superfamily II [Azotobacter beijerinckii]SFK84431.1 Glyoxylase, beta-lactamase superfamily II [Azotobacter beijerinckii]